MKKLNGIFAAALAALFAACVLLTGCSNSSDNSAALALIASGGGSSSGARVPTDEELKAAAQATQFSATAESGGIRFNISALPESIRDAYIFIEGGAVGAHASAFNAEQCVPVWPDKSAAWSGLYPFTTSGKTYEFKLNISLKSGSIVVKLSSVQVAATGGSGELSYNEANWSALLTSKEINSEKVLEFNMTGADFPFSTSGIVNPKWSVLHWNGSAMQSGSWDGSWLGEESWDSGKTFPFLYIKSSYDAITSDKMNGNSNKKIFLQINVSFSFAGSTNCNFNSAGIISNVIDYPW